MDLARLKTYLAVLDTGGFARAGRTLDLQQSTISFHIKALEEEVGVRLLDRTGGRVRATAAGRTLARYAERLVSLSEEALQRLRAEAGVASGRLSIAASTIPGEYLLPSVLAVYLARHPSVRVRVAVSDSAGALASLLAHEVDLALTGSASSDRRALLSPIADDEIVLVGPSPNPFAATGRLTARDLGRVPLVLRESGSGTQQSVAAFLARHGLRGTVELGSTEAVKRAVRAGMGLGFISRLAVAEEVATGKLTPVEVPGLPLRRSFYVAWLRGTTLSPAAAALVDLLLASAAPAARTRPARGAARKLASRTAG